MPSHPAALGSSVLRLTARQHAALATHLFPGDGLEAVAILLCGRGGSTPDREVLAAHSVHPIIYADCSVRTPDRVSWRTEALMPLLAKAAKQNLGLVKIHSHPGGYAAFSTTDDEADRELFPGLYGWTDGTRPHLSAVMLPEGRIFAREVSADGSFRPCPDVVSIGVQLRFWRVSGPRFSEQDGYPGVHQRAIQAFGAGTVQLLRHLRVGVVGCSGTGSWVIEMLTRLGVGRLVLIDPDRVELHNLNRIVHASAAHAAAAKSKVSVLSEAVERAGLGTTVDALAIDVMSAQAVEALSKCDVVFGCTDAIDAREVLNRITVYYQVPLIDVGVRLEANGVGGIEQIVGSVHYLHPDARGFLERGLYTPAQLYTAGLQRDDPEAYADQVRERYIRGANEDRPAVASVNALYASLAVNELLARIHEVRDDQVPIESLTMSLTQLRLLIAEETGTASSYARWIGRGDCQPLLGMVGLEGK